MLLYETGYWGKGVDENDATMMVGESESALSLTGEKQSVSDKDVNC